MFAQCLIALSVATTLGSGIACWICIQLIVVIVVHPHMTLLHPFSDSWLSHFVQSVPYIDSVFSLDTDPTTSLQARRTRARTNEVDMIAEYAFFVSVMNLSIQLMN
jgi:hypothetical protein